MEQHPRIIEVDREGMKTLERIAASNMQASEAENALQNLKSQETEYVAEREGRTAAAIEKVVADSEEVLTMATKNYEAVNAISGTVEGLAGKVKDIVGRVRVVMQLFDEKSRLWESRVKTVEERLDVAKKQGMAQKAALDAQRSSQDKRADELVAWEEDLRSRETALRKDVMELTPN